MKIAIIGSTGYLGQDLVKQALSHPKITSVVGISRRETAAPIAEQLSPSADISRLSSVIVKDFSSDWGQDEKTRSVLENLDAAIWTIAITPGKSNLYSWDDVIKVCRDYAVNGQKILSNIPRTSGAPPLRFVYLSGSSAERDPKKKPWILGNYSLMRGEAESQILSYATSTPEKVSAMIAKPGLINDPAKDPIAKKVGMVVLGAVGVVPSVQLSIIAKALLEQVTREGRGFEKDTLTNDDLRLLGGQE